MNTKELREIIWDHYSHHQRDLPWRHPDADGSFDAYKILVSEIMLQQTQAKRVIPKYLAFLATFPTVHDLAGAQLATVLSHWSGLGYNRRAKYLHEAAKHLAATSQPWSLDDLVACKGIGANTAAAVLTYAYDQPQVFIETNIRTIFIHHFFADADQVTDAQLLPFVRNTLDPEHPREFGWALMDYGVHLKTTVGNATRVSRHYAKQSRFEGSRRKVRGHTLRLLATQNYTKQELLARLNDERAESVLQDLLQEGLVSERQGMIIIGS